MNTTGASMTKPGPQSFKNPNDNNPRIEALARVRGGGASVPPKVSNRVTIPYIIPRALPLAYIIVLFLLD